MNTDKLLEIAKKKSFDKIRLFLEDYKGEQIYVAEFNHTGDVFGYPLFMTMRGDKPYIFDDDETLQILAYKKKSKNSPP